MRSPTDAGIRGWRISARPPERVRPYRIFSNLLRPARPFHFADVAQKSFELICSGERIAVEYRIESPLLLFGTEQVFGQRSHSFCREFYHLRNCLVFRRFLNVSERYVTANSLENLGLTAKYCSQPIRS